MKTSQGSKIKMKTYGLWHMREECYLGNAEKPLQYTDWDLAKAAATIATEMFHSLVRPVELPIGLIKNGTITSDLDGSEAISKILKKP